MKKKVVLCIAASLDGFIARENGGIDWLFSDQDYGYSKFYKGIGIVIVGNNTYKQSLSFEEYPFKSKECYVFSRKKKGKDRNAVFTNKNAKKLVAELKNKKIWLVGVEKSLLNS